MNLFFGHISEEKLNPKIIGKKRAFILRRQGIRIRFKGSCLVLFNIDDSDLLPAKSYIKLAAIFKSSAGKYIVYYIVEHIGNEHQQGCMEYTGIFSSQDEMFLFLEKMNWSNRADFIEGVNQSLLEKTP